MSDYYKFAQVRTTKDALMIAGKRTGRIMIGYLSASILVYFGIRKIVYRLTERTVSESEFSSSFDNAAIIAKVTDFKGVYNFDIKIFSAFAAPFVFVSSCMFAIFGGLGMALLPLSLIQQFRDRPKQWSPEEEVIAKKMLLKESEEAIKRAVKMREVERDLKIIKDSDTESKFLTQRKLDQQNRKAKEAWLTFEELFRAYNKEKNILKANPLLEWGSLVLGIFFSLVSVCFVGNAFLAIFQNYIIFETITRASKKEFFFYPLIMIVLISFYFLLAILAGSTKLCRIFHGFMNTFPVRKNATFTHSFCFYLNLVIMGLFGMTVHLIRSLPDFLRFSEFNYLINRLIVHIRFVHYFYQFHLFEYVFVLTFMFGLVIFSMKPSPTQVLRQKLQHRLKEHENEREKLKEIEKQLKND